MMTIRRLIWLHEDDDKHHVAAAKYDADAGEGEEHEAASVGCC